jgi:3-oxoacyl-(acyl-carrier-protein) synthase
MLAAIQDAGLTLKDIHYINAHATATEAGDKAENRHQDLFGNTPRDSISSRSP